MRTQDKTTSEWGKSFRTKEIDVVNTLQFVVTTGPYFVLAVNTQKNRQNNNLATSSIVNRDQNFGSY